MTYFQILAFFVIAPLAALVLRLRKELTRLELGMLGLLSLVALIYTTPWDNYLVATRVWWYDPQLVTGITLAWVPLEEYGFFILQTWLSGVWLLYLVRAFGNERLRLSDSPDHFSSLRMWSPIAAGLVWLVGIGLLASGWQPGTYLGLELAWALPPIMVQLAFGADILWNRRWLVLSGILSSTLYLSFTDWIAIGLGTWTINPSKSLNVFLAGYLPVEEFIFFLATNILIIFGMVLGLAPESHSRLPQRLRPAPKLSGEA